EAQLAVADPAEYVARAREQLVARRDVVDEARARQEQRALRVQHLWIERADRAARLAVEHHQPAERETVEPLVERRPADRIVDDLHALAGGQPLPLGLEVLLRVEDGLVRSRLTRELGLLLGRDRADNAGAAHLRDLTQEQPDAP